MLLPRPQEWRDLLRDIYLSCNEDTSLVRSKIHTEFGLYVPEAEISRGISVVMRYMWRETEGNANYPSFF